MATMHHATATANVNCQCQHRRRCLQLSLPLCLEIHCKTKPCITVIYSKQLEWILRHIIEYHTPAERREEKLLFFLMDKHVEHRKYFLVGYPGMYVRNNYFNKSIPTCVNQFVNVCCTELSEMDATEVHNTVNNKNTISNKKKRCRCQQHEFDSSALHGKLVTTTLSTKSYYEYRYNQKQE
jgi:hypothetical protein